MNKSTFKSVIGIIALLTICLFVLSSCDNNENVNDPEEDGVMTISDSVFVYNLNGIAEYTYDDDGRVSEIITLDPYTLNPYLINEGTETCRYTYNASGVLDKLSYFGRDFTPTATNENGLPTRFESNDSKINVYVDISYNSNGNILTERFFENGKEVLFNVFDSNFRPKSSKYSEFGSLTYDYYDSETYITVKSKDDPQADFSIEIYLDEYNMPKYCMQSIDGAVMGITWTFDSNGRCIDTLVESKADDYSLTEKYEVYYSDKGRMSSMKYYVPNNDGAPRLSTEFLYSYGSEGNFIKQTEKKYNVDGVLETVTEYDYSEALVEKTTIEYYADGKINKTEITSKAYDSNGRVVSASQYVMLPDATFESAQVTLYKYNSSGNIEEYRTENFDKNNKLDNYLIAEYTYDSKNMATKVVYTAFDADNTFIEKEIDEFVYDENYNVLTSSVTMFGSDDAIVTKTVTEREYNDSGEITKTVTTTYDAEGNVIENT